VDELRLPSGTDTCTLCMDSEEETPESENVFHLFLRLQDERGNAQITVTVDQNVRLLCQVLIILCLCTCATRANFWTVSRLTTS